MMKTAILLMLITLCFNTDAQALMTNTPESKAAHGYKEGEATSLIVGDVHLLIPSEISFMPRTYGKFTVGYAEEISTGLTYDIDTPFLHFKKVVIIIQPSKGPPSADWKDPIERNKWEKVIERKDLGLKEFHRFGPSTGWGHVSYTPVEEGIRLPEGRRLVYICAGYPKGVVVRCELTMYLNGLRVSYILPKTLLPKWKAIHMDVIDLVKSFIVR